MAGWGGGNRGADRVGLSGSHRPENRDGRPWLAAARRIGGWGCRRQSAHPRRNGAQFRFGGSAPARRPADRPRFRGARLCPRAFVAAAWPGTLGWRGSRRDGADTCQISTRRPLAGKDRIGSRGRHQSKSRGSFHRHRFLPSCPGPIFRRPRTSVRSHSRPKHASSRWPKWRQRLLVLGADAAAVEIARPCGAWVAKGSCCFATAGCWPSVGPGIPAAIPDRGAPGLDGGDQIPDELADGGARVEPRGRPCQAVDEMGRRSKPRIFFKCPA